MTKFIKLTEIYNGLNPQPLILNTTFIRSVKLGKRGEDVMIQMEDTKFFFVQESLDTVWNMLVTDNTKAPIMMDAEQYRIYKTNGEQANGLGR